MSSTHDHVDGGLEHDLPRLLSRRRVLGGLLGVSGSALLAACSPSARSTGPGATGEIPAETAGPFPANGSDGADVLSEAGVVRRDIRSSIGGAGGTAQGVPLTLRLEVVELSGSTRTPLEGAAVYVWHTDRNGDYSLYSPAAAKENYLRGVQVADADGIVEFTSIFPACYPGRWPHVHLEVYPTLDAATSSARSLRTTQLALPREACEQAYAAPGYEQSVRHLAQVTLEGDVSFSDGYALQLARMTGSNAAGWTAELTVGL